MRNRWQQFWWRVNQEIGSGIFLLVLLYGDILYGIEKTYKDFKHRKKIEKIHKENPDIVELTKLAGIKNERTCSTNTSSGNTKTQ
jgi:hypothetical protein